MIFQLVGGALICMIIGAWIMAWVVGRMVKKSELVIKYDGTWHGTELAMDEIAAQHYNRNMVAGIGGDNKAAQDEALDQEEEEGKLGR